MEGEMKNLKLIFGIITLVLLITSCAGNAQSAGYGGSGGSGTAFSSNIDELDIAIRDASDYLADNLPAGSTIVILNIESDSTSLSNYIIEELIANAVNDRVFTVVDRQQLDAIRAEQNFQFSGEVDDNLALEIGRFFGAQTIVSGSLRPLGARYRLTIRALGVQTAQVQGQYNRNINEVTTIRELLKDDRPAAASATAARPAATTTPAPAAATPAPAPAPAATAPTPTPAPAATAAPASGTYLFWPRIRAYENGIPINAFIYQIVVRGNNFLVYIGDSATGPSSSYFGHPGSFLQGRGVITNLDRPSQSWARIGDFTSPSTGNNSIGSFINSFQNVTGNRFSLQSGASIFEEFKLSDAEYTP